MERVLEQSEFLKDVCKLVMYATELGYAVTSDAILPPSQLDAPTASFRYARVPGCAIDLHFFRRAHGTFKPAEAANSLQPLAAFWESLSPRNVWKMKASGAERVPCFERQL